MSKPVIAVLILAVLLLLPLAVLLLISGHTTLAFDPAPAAVGMVTPVHVKLTNPHGVRRVTAFIEQNGTRNAVQETLTAPSRLFFWRKHLPPADFAFTAGKEKAPAIKDGKARLIVQTQSNDLRGTVDEIAADIDVITRPPSVLADSLQHYINQGGSELVLFTPSGYWTEAGVRVGKYTFRSFPKPGSKTERFALFAFPWDLSPETIPVVYVRNPAGSEVTAKYWFKLFPKKFRKRDLDINDAFLEKVDTQIDGSATGDLITRFLKLNGEMRRQNNQALADLRLKSADRFLWTTTFQQMMNTKVESQFADVRSYVYRGKKVDEQVHLGFDLSSVKNAPVPAANDGKIVFAENLGIYGNCIVVDHGYGLQSIYGHLSRIDVKPGESVTKGQTMGLSGSTGLAGGDHLHFSMQLDGVQINPVEWWDGHWIHDRIQSKLSGETIQDREAGPQEPTPHPKSTKRRGGKRR